jgi:hypothetical protein
MDGLSQTGGGSKFELSDIGDYRSADDIFVIAGASIFALLLLTIVARIGGLGGLPLNTYFDAFGLEGILSNAMILIILIQIARYLYSTLYSSSGKAWSPIVFLCFVLIAQAAYDLFFYYGVINVVPQGVNDMVDVLRAYSKQSTLNTMGAHAVLILVTALTAMIMCDMSLVTRLLTGAVILSLFPFVLSIVTKKPAPPPPPPQPPKEEMRDYRGFSL